MTQTGTDTEAGRLLSRLVANVEGVVRGKPRLVRLAVVCLIAEGHLLLEDAPGTGKTTLAEALARSTGLLFRRIQFTSDLLPSDVLGVSTPGPDGAFVLRRGPVFAQVVLADELNRTSPRTQSALLECMHEGRVSLDGETHELPKPFLVVATQNPLEFEGTYPLPESQLDRFLMRLSPGYPDRSAEREILRAHERARPLDALEPVLGPEQLLGIIAEVRAVRVDDALVDYVLEVLAASRESGRFLLGLSPRAGLGWLRAARALALLSGREFCVPDDVHDLAVPVLSHRVVPAPDATAELPDPRRAVRELLTTVAVPG